MDNNSNLLQSNIHLQMRVLLFVLFFSFHNTLTSQELVVKDCQFLNDDPYIIQHPREDNNGNLCAVVKIMGEGLKDLQFPNKAQYVGECEYENGVYYVYIPATTYRLDFRHPSYLPGVIDMYNQFGYKAKGGKTYLVTFEVPNVDEKESSGTMVFKVTPAQSGKIQIGTTQYDFDNSSIEINHSLGKCKYLVRSPYYEDYIGTYNVKEGINYVSVSLRPKVVPIEIICNVSSAHIYVDNVDYGNVGMCNLPLGDHLISVRANKYIDYNQMYTIEPTITAIPVTLQKNKGKTVDVHPINVKINCSTKKLYKNNKPLPNWYDGATIKFMPGEKCLLSDDYDNQYWFIPGSEDMEIQLNKGVIITK